MRVRCWLVQEFQTRFAGEIILALFGTCAVQLGGAGGEVSLKSSSLHCPFVHLKSRTGLDL